MLSSFQHLRILKSTVYVFFYEEEYTLKLAKCDAKALKRKLIEFDKYIIYKVHIKEQYKVIKVKDLQDFKDTAVKTFSALPDFNGKPMFDGIKLSDTKKNSSPSKWITYEEEIKIKRQAQKAILPSIKRQKPTLSIGEPKQTPAEQIVKLTSKVRNKVELLPRADNIEILIKLLVRRLGNNWEENQRISTFFTRIDQKNVPNISLEPLHILAISLHNRNSIDPNDFVFAT